MLHHDLGLKAFNVAENRGDGEHAPIALEPQEAVLARDITVDRDLVPILGMSDIVDRDVVMLTPEKRHGGERIVATKHVECSGLPLALSDGPVLNADVFARTRVGPTRDVAGGGRQVGVDRRAHRALAPTRALRR